MKPLVKSNNSTGSARQTFLMCRPNFYGIRYQINHWMSFGNPSHLSTAIYQWNELKDKILELGADVKFVKDREGLPDMVFTANGGTVIDNKRVVISNFKHQERKGEEEWFAQWFGEEGWELFYPSSPYEGAGDVLSLGETMVCGVGFRSTVESHLEVAEFYGRKIVIANLVDPRFYHLDTCFCPLSNGYFLIYPKAFGNIEDINKLEHEPIMVSESDAERFACNAVCIGNNVILPSGCQKTMDLLSEHGYNPIPVDMSEFIKSGGACKCLTLELTRSVR